MVIEKAFGYPKEVPYFEQLSDTVIGNFFKNFAKPGDVVFDVGANLGQSSEVARAGRWEHWTRF